MAIKVNEANLEKIQTALDEVQGRCKERIVTAKRVMKSCEEIEEYFGISKKAMTGLVVNVDVHAEKYARAYKYTPRSTQYTLERRASGWYVYNIGREITGGTLKMFEVSTMPEETKKALINRFTKF